MRLQRRTSCRVCGSPHLTPVIDLGEQYLQGSFVKEGAPQLPTTKFPMLLLRCDTSKNSAACGLLQMAHSVPADILYSNYWYRSNVNSTMREHLKSIAHVAMSMVKGDHRGALDIGCNDGTLLRNYPETFERFGVDPSDIARGIEPPIRVINTVYPSDEATAALAGRSVDIVTSIAMFYDLDDPVGFAKSIKSVLAPGGIWIVEMSYLPTMLEQNSFDTICHEHVEYYSLAVLEFIFRAAGLRAARAELNAINGGSIRLYVAHAENATHGTPEDRAELQRLRDREASLDLGSDRPYTAFQERILAVRDKLTALLRAIRAEGKTIHVYGASTKGNVLLQWYGIDRTVVECAADRNPEKHGARTLGTDIPIVSEEQSRALKPDYYLVLPWHFKNEFLQREREAIMAGTSMIFPLPEVLVVGRDDLPAER
ncbi:MAG: class I SAM-dependent methyltransferase [Xanthobacteraceae bacterium]|nr:class I SAM-dependent methyltransferase [Xanthobacteraceae bacterium]